MSIATALTKLETDISNAYDKIEERGGTLPENKNTDSLTNAIDSIPSGGGIVEAKDKDVNFYTYDGVRVASYTASEFANLTAMPNSPTYELLDSDGWNWTLSDAQAHVANYGGLDIGDLCHTKDNTMKIFVSLINKYRLNPYLCLNLNGTVNIDWGDGTTSTLSGTSVSSPYRKQHTYQNPGEYVISISRVGSASVQLPTSNSDYCLILTGTPTQSSASTDNATSYYISRIKKIMLPTYIRNCNEHQFVFCNNLESVNLQAMTTLQSNVFKGCSKLKFLTVPVPRSSMAIYSNCFYMTTGLKAISLPLLTGALNYWCFYGSGIEKLWLTDNSTLSGSSVLAGGNYNYKPALTKLVLPSGVTTAYSNAFQYQSALVEVIFNGNVTSLGGGVFNGCTSLRKVTFLNNTAVPSLSSSTFDALSYYPSDFKIVVPDDLYDSWKVASNWSNYASAIVKASSAS